MTGSAIRKPSIQPGYGRARALSMIEGRTMASGLSPAASSSAISVRALVKVYTSGQPRLRARERPYSTSRSRSQERRCCSLRLATDWGPARPISERALASNRASCSGRRESVSTWVRTRRAASHSVRQRSGRLRSSSGCVPRVSPAT